MSITKVPQCDGLGHFRAMYTDTPLMPLTPSTTETQRTLRLETLVADISARLRRVCGHLPDEQFAALALDIALTTLKYQEREEGVSLVTKPAPPARPEVAAGS